MNYPGVLAPLAVALCWRLRAAEVQAAGVAYRNPALTVDERVADLVGRMTLEEKVGQLMMSDARSEDLSFINTRQPGSVLHILGAKVGRAMDLAAQNRLGIPLLVGEDGMHGHSFWKGSTIFPTQLGLAGSWNRELVAQVGRVTAEEMAPTGIMDVLARALPHAGPALGPHRRDLRRGPAPDGELGARSSVASRARVSTTRRGARDGQALAGYSETSGSATHPRRTPAKAAQLFLPPFDAPPAPAMTF